MLPFWTKALCFFVVFLTADAVCGQGPVSDLDLVASEDFHQHEFEPYRPQYLFKHSSPLIKYNPITATFGGLMYGYQRFVSVQISAECVYHQSCSRFSVDALRTHGLIKGIALSADRLSRCNSLAATDALRYARHPESHKPIDSVEAFKFKRK